MQLPFKISCGILIDFKGWGYKALTDFKISSPYTVSGEECKPIDVAKGDILYVNRDEGTFTYQGKTYEGAWIDSAVSDSLLVPFISLAYLLGWAKHEPRVNEFKMSNHKIRVKEVSIGDHLVDTQVERLRQRLRQQPLTPLVGRNLPDTELSEYKAFSDDVRTDLCDLDETDAATYTIDPENLDKEPPTNLTEEERLLVDDPDFWDPTVDLPKPRDHQIPTSKLEAIRKVLEGVKDPSSETPQSETRSAKTSNLTEV